MAKTRRAKKERRRMSPTKLAREHKSGFPRTVFRVPEGVEVFQIDKAGTYRLDIMEYEAGKGNRYADEGMSTYEKTFWTHWNIGADGNSYVCPAKTWKKACPICEERKRMEGDDSVDQKTTKAMFPKRRQLFNVIDVKEKEKGVQIYEASFHTFGELLSERVLGIVDDPDSKQNEIDRWENFCHWADGCTLKVVFKDKDIGFGNPWRLASSIDTIPRDQKYEESILEDVHCLDDLLIEVPYKKLKSILLQQGEDEEDESEGDDQDSDEEEREDDDRGSDEGGDNDEDGDKDPWDEDD